MNASRVASRCLLVIALSVAWGRGGAEPPGSPATTPAAALRAACQFLWSQQADDGGWHSKQYGVLRLGQALTPFVLHALLQVPQDMCPRPEGGVDRAIEFIRQHVDEQGSLGHADPDIAEYPVYSTAYALKCLVTVGDANDYDLAIRMSAFLIMAQLDESDGFDPSMPAYGGWGFDAPQRSGQPGHMDLAHTRRALEAVMAARNWRKKTTGLCGKSVTSPHAEMFLRVVQRHPDAIAPQPRAQDGNQFPLAAPYDGGFYFSPVVLAANKGREQTNAVGANFFRSYATATCDGILALLAVEIPREDERMVRAVEWLRGHNDLNYPQGVPQSHPEPWGEAIRFYHYAVRAEAYDRLEWPGDWRSKLAAAVIQQQAADGSFRNTVSPLMKEDDPLLATTLAAVALSHCSK